jgi:hypothetical protein
MPIYKSNTFQSDEIGIVFNYDGSETKQIRNWGRRYKEDFPFRVAFAINQSYPELRSGSYRNKKLIALIQEALSRIELSVVIEDNYVKDGVVPEELAGSLEIGDDYLLIDERMNVQGRLNVWKSLGGKGDFYHDKFILEIVTSHKNGEEMASAVKNKCKLMSVACSVMEGVAQ